MGWQDAPVVASPTDIGAAQPAWMQAPVVAATTPVKPSFATTLFNALPVSPMKMAVVNPVGNVETAANLATGAIATPIAGLAGLGAAALKELGLSDKEPADVVRGVQSALTYEPRTPAGKAETKGVNYPFQKLGEFADWAGSHIATSTGSPAVGALVNTAIQALPAALMRGKGAAAEDAAAGETAQTTVTPEARAQEYVARNTGLDWNALSGAVKDRLTSIAKDATTLDMLDPKAVERQARLESLPVPVPATKGQLTRDPVQLRNEGNVSATAAGKPIADIHDAQNQALLDNLDLLKNEQGGVAASAEQTGASVQDAARAKLDLQKQTVSDLYAKAKAAGDLEAPVSPKPILQTIAQSPDKTHFGWVQSWLSDMGVVNKTDAGTVINKLKLGELEDLRQAAVARTRDGGTSAYYAGKVIDAIDQATAGAGGDAYQAARAARKAQGTEFEQQGGVAALVDNKSRTDRATALEDTWRKTVLGGSNDDLSNVRDTLITGGNDATKAKGLQAWKDLRAQTIQYIKDQATKGVAPRQDGSLNITPAALQNAVRAVGADKLEILFGSGTTKRLNDILQATKDVKTLPPSAAVGSSTFANMLAFLEKSIGRVPLVGDTVTGAVRGVAALRKMGASAREANAAAKTPLDTGVQAANDAQANARIKALLLRNRGVGVSAATQSGN